MPGRERLILANQVERCDHAVLLRYPSFEDHFGVHVVENKPCRIAFHRHAQTLRSAVAK